MEHLECLFDFSLSCQSTRYNTLDAFDTDSEAAGVRDYIAGWRYQSLQAFKPDLSGAPYDSNGYR